MPKLNVTCKVVKKKKKKNACLCDIYFSLTFSEHLCNYYLYYILYWRSSITLTVVTFGRHYVALQYYVNYYWIFIENNRWILHKIKLKHNELIRICIHCTAKILFNINITIRKQIFCTIETFSSLHWWYVAIHGFKNYHDSRFLFRMSTF